MNNCIYNKSFSSFDVRKMYGTPPFEPTNIEQLLINFCMLKFNRDSSVSLN